MRPMNLLDDTVSRLGRIREKGASLRSIATEPGVPYEWLKKFAGGHIQGPSVNRIEALNAHLRALERGSRSPAKTR